MDFGQLFDRLWSKMSTDQKQAALHIMKRNLQHHDDWIVLDSAIHTLCQGTKTDRALAVRLRAQLERLSADLRTSVASRGQITEAAAAASVTIPLSFLDICCAFYEPCPVITNIGFYLR